SDARPRSRVPSRFPLRCIHGTARGQASPAGEASSCVPPSNRGRHRRLLGDTLADKAATTARYALAQQISAHDAGAAALAFANPGRLAINPLVGKSDDVKS